MVTEIVVVMANIRRIRYARIEVFSLKSLSLYVFPKNVTRKFWQILEIIFKCQISYAWVRHAIKNSLMRSSAVSVGIKQK